MVPQVEDKKEESVVILSDSEQHEIAEERNLQVEFLQELKAFSRDLRIRLSKITWW